MGPSCSWSYDSWIYIYLCNQCLSPLKLWVQIPLIKLVIDLRQVGGFLWVLSLVSSSNKTDRHDITKMLKVALSTITLTLMICVTFDETGSIRGTLMHFSHKSGSTVGWSLCFCLCHCGTYFNAWFGNICSNVLLRLIDHWLVNIQRQIFHVHTKREQTLT